MEEFYSRLTSGIVLFLQFLHSVCQLLHQHSQVIFCGSITIQNPIVLSLDPNQSTDSQQNQKPGRHREDMDCVLISGLEKVHV